MSGFRYHGTAAVKYLIERFSYHPTGNTHMSSLDDVIWSRAREALSLRTELAHACRRITDEVTWIEASLERSAKRAEGGHGFVYQPMERVNLAATTAALNARERELEELCRAAEILGAMTVPGTADKT